jgi:hypothetical protein
MLGRVRDRPFLGRPAVARQVGTPPAARQLDVIEIGEMVETFAAIVVATVVVSVVLLGIILAAVLAGSIPSFL